MLKKKQRLNGKEIAYILRKGKKVYGRFLIFRYIPQYKNIPYWQASIQIPVKLDKRAAMRNLLKRNALLEFEKQMKQSAKILKVFVFVNKKALTPLKKGIDESRLASKDKTRILNLREEGCKKDFISFFQSIGKHSSSSFRQGGNNYKKRSPLHISKSKQ